MPVDENRNRLRSILEKKTTQELEELLLLDFAEQDNSESSADYITTIMEVIEEREKGEREGSREDDEAAWQEFKEYLELRKAEALDTGVNEVSDNDHSCKSTTDPIPHRNLSRVLRYCLIAAIIVILISAPAVAGKWNFIYAIAEWSKETFQFLIPNQDKPAETDDPFLPIRLAVAKHSDTLVIPFWAPDGTEGVGEITVVERPDKVRIQGRFKVEDDEYTIQVILHATPPDSLTGTYQKDETFDNTIDAGGISHNVADNYNNVSAMWINGCLEVYIQGDLSLEDLQKMIESIYWEKIS